MKALIEVNLETIQKGKKELLMCEARDYVENNLESGLNDLYKGVIEIQEFLDTPLSN
jgi:hypothetical protein